MSYIVNLNSILSLQANIPFMKGRETNISKYLNSNHQEYLAQNLTLRSYQYGETVINESVREPISHLGRHEFKTD